MTVLMRPAVNEANPNILIGLVPRDNPRFVVIPLPRTQGVARAGDALWSPFLGFVVVRLPRPGFRRRARADGGRALAQSSVGGLEDGRDTGVFAGILEVFCQGGEVRVIAGLFERKVRRVDGGFVIAVARVCGREGERKGKERGESKEGCIPHDVGSKEITVWINERALLYF